MLHDQNGSEIASPLQSLLPFNENKLVFHRQPRWMDLAKLSDLHVIPDSERVLYRYS